jgi:FHA domain
VSATCPNGHRSSTTDYCDHCGARIESAPEALHADTGSTPVTSTSPANAPCPGCGLPRAGRDRYCEDCGHDFSSAPPAVAIEFTGWAAQVSPDRAYFDRTAPDGLDFPVGEDPRTIALEVERVRIGRRRASGDDAPEIELGDPAVSRLHATLVRAPDGSWAIVDEGSSNGTTINAAPDPIPPHVEVPLQDGDSVHLGAWTTITLGLRSRAA